MTRQWNIPIHSLDGYSPKPRLNRPAAAVLLLLAGCSLLYRYDAPRRNAPAPMLTPTALPKPKPAIASVTISGEHAHRPGLAPFSMDVSLTRLPPAATAALGPRITTAGRTASHAPMTATSGRVSALAIGQASAAPFNATNTDDANQPTVTLDVFSQTR